MFCAYAVSVQNMGINAIKVQIWILETVLAIGTKTFFVAKREHHTIDKTNFTTMSRSKNTKVRNLE